MLSACMEYEDMLSDKQRGARYQGNGIIILLPFLGECWLRTVPKAMPWAIGRLPLRGAANSPPPRRGGVRGGVITPIQKEPADTSRADRLVLKRLMKLCNFRK